MSARGIFSNSLSLPEGREKDPEQSIFLVLQWFIWGPSLETRWGFRFIFGIFHLSHFPPLANDGSLFEGDEEVGQVRGQASRGCRLRR